MQSDESGPRDCRPRSMIDARSLPMLRGAVAATDSQRHYCRKRERVARRRAVRELRDMWQDTRMIVFTAISAALYASILIPFKVMPIIPGVTEFRPANAVPVICSLLFGPAGAWGSAIGNLIGDLFGG